MTAIIRTIGITGILLIATVLGACRSDDSADTSDTATPTPTSQVAPWTADSAVAIDREAILAGGQDAWLVVDPNTGAPTRLEPIGGYVPRQLAGDRFDLVSTRSGTLARIDIVTGEIADIGAGWTGQITADGKWAAILPEVEGQTLAVVDVDSGERFNLGQLGKPVMLVWSDDDTLAVVRDEVLYIARGPDWRPERVGDFNHVWPVWSPDSQWLAVPDTYGVRLIAPSTGEERLLKVGPGPPNAAGGWMAWSPNGTRIAVGGGSGWYVVDVDTGKVTNIAPNGAGAQESTTPVWSPDGSAVAALVVPDKHDTYSIGVAVAQADGSGARMISTGGSAPLAWTDAGILQRLTTMP